MMERKPADGQFRKKINSENDLTLLAVLHRDGRLRKNPEDFYLAEFGGFVISQGC